MWTEMKSTTSVDLAPLHRTNEHKKDFITFLKSPVSLTRLFHCHLFTFSSVSFHYSWDYLTPSPLLSPVYDQRLEPPCSCIPIFITFRGSALLSTTVGGQRGLIITKTKHLLNSARLKNRKKSAVAGILASNPSFPKVKTQEKQRWLQPSAALRAEMCSLRPFCQHSFILRTRQHLCHSVWAASQHYGNFKAPCHHLNACYSSLPREDLLQHQTRDGKRMKRKTVRHSLCQKTWKISEK